jgi:D-alanine--poly(phosphoribitol) ligase subunit 1
MTSWVVNRLREIIESNPEHVAICQGSRQTTYGDFGSMIAGLATKFAATSQAPRVAICAEPCAETYASMFAAMMAGGFYVPLNANAGQSRLETAFEEIAPDVAVFSKNTLPLSVKIGYSGPIVNTEDAVSGKWPDAVSRNAHRLAYVIFTSGSTGKPKGVMVSQNALAGYACWANSAMQVSPSDRWSQHPNIGFDLSVLDIYGALLGGATLYPLNSPIDHLLPARAIGKHKLTVWNSVPSVMGMMLRSGDWSANNASSLRLLTFCGEPLLPEHLDGIFRVLPDVVVHNTYGPTEATVSCSLLQLTKDTYHRHAKNSIALGNAIEGTEFFIKDVNNYAAQSGELLIAGSQLADGYWMDSARTKESFKQISVNGREIVAYHTGDFVELDATGLYFTERKDRQVKIKGHRVELNEISSHIRKLGYIHAETFFDGTAIIALVEGEEQDDALPEISQYLESRLESYMLPRRIAFISKFPRNSNDKIDLAALKALWDNLDLRRTIS